MSAQVARLDHLTRSLQHTSTSWQLQHCCIDQSIYLSINQSAPAANARNTSGGWRERAHLSGRRIALVAYASFLDQNTADTISARGRS